MTINPDPLNKTLWLTFLIFLYGNVFSIPKKSSRNLLFSMFGVAHHEQKEKTQKKEYTVRKKKDWEKYALWVSILGLIISSLLTGVIALKSFELTQQSNDIAQQSLNLQTYPPIIAPISNRIYLDEYVDYYTSGTNQTSITSGGTYNFSVSILSPIGGKLNVSIENFTAVDYANILDKDKLNKTELVNQNNLQTQINDKIISSGLNQKDFSIPLWVRIYPDSNRMNFTDAQYFPVGILYLKASFYDVQNMTTNQEFSEVVIAKVAFERSPE